MFYSNYRLYKNKWYGTAEGLTAFSNLSITVINSLEDLVNLNVLLIKRMFLLTGSLLRSGKTKAFVKYLVSSSFGFHATQEKRKLLTLFKAHFFIDRSSRIFNKDFGFVVCTRLAIETPILSDKLCQWFLLTDHKLWLASHYEMFACFLCVTFSSLQKFCLFLDTHMLSFTF